MKLMKREQKGGLTRKIFSMSFHYGFYQCWKVFPLQGANFVFIVKQKKRWNIFVLILRYFLKQYVKFSKPSITPKDDEKTQQLTEYFKAIHGWENNEKNRKWRKLNLFPRGCRHQLQLKFVWLSIQNYHLKVLNN